MPTRLNKYLSEIGYCSRREADRLIENGDVFVNGSPSVIGAQVEETDEITVKGQVVSRTSKYIYILFNKPTGVTSTTDLKDKTNMIEYINHKERIFPIGRLDKDSEGLILLTSDGDIVNKVLRSGNNHEKEYIVRVDKPITDAFLNNMRNGVKILNTVTKPATVRQLSTFTFSIVLKEGLNRQIRRMCSTLGYRVFKLERVRIMHITDKSLKRGAWRYLTKKEEQKLKELVKDSSKTEEAST